MGYWEQIGVNNRQHAEAMSKLPRWHWRRVDWLGWLMVLGGVAFWGAVVWRLLR